MRQPQKIHSLKTLNLRQSKKIQNQNWFKKFRRNAENMFSVRFTETSAENSTDSARTEISSRSRKVLTNFFWNIKSNLKNWITMPGQNSLKKSTRRMCCFIFFQNLSFRCRKGRRLKSTATFFFLNLRNVTAFTAEKNSAQKSMLTILFPGVL